MARQSPTMHNGNTPGRVKTAIDLTEYFEGGFFNLNYEWRKRDFPYDKAIRITAIKGQDGFYRVELENVSYPEKEYRGYFLLDLRGKRVAGAGRVTRDG